MSNENWSEWFNWHGAVTPPVDEEAIVDVEYRCGKVAKEVRAGSYRWTNKGCEVDIVAYRIKDDEMHPDLEWLARTVHEWQGTRYVTMWKGSVVWTDESFPGAVSFMHEQWLQARKDLGLDSTGIADPDEEECLQMAYERMGDESVKVSVDELHDNVNKPKHYQLREGYEVYDLRQDLAAKAANGGATYDQYSDWDRAIEYIIRMWGKNRLEDAKKGRWYLDKLIGKLEDQG